MVREKKEKKKRVFHAIFAKSDVCGTPLMGEESPFLILLTFSFCV